ncbi:porin [Phenylobacterium sp.]|uniref:porin n=1 Tax=Phenylobacterium sp. TaxID=1871053 RepID=UPI0025E8EF9A|nr:porin [Phenylobacterium sp.]
MGMSLKRGASAWLSASLAGVLLCGVSTVALAAPATAASDARLQTMQSQLDDLRAQLNQMRAAGSQTNAQDTRLAAIQQQLDAMAQQLVDLKGAQTADAGAIATLQTPQGGFTIPTLPNGKPALATADGRFTANIKAIVMFDAGKSFQKNNLPASVTNRDLNEGTNFRRARFGIDGKLFRDFDYALIYEFGGSGGEDAGHIQEAWVQYTYLKPWRIKVGAFEPNIGLAAAVSTSQMPMLERPAPAEIARNVAAGDSRSAVQLQANGVMGAGDSGLAARWFVSTAFTGNTVGTINSTGSSAAQPFGEQTAWIGRLAVAPFSSTDWQGHLGVNAQYVTQPNDAGAAANPRYPITLRDRPELRIDGTRLVDTGAIDIKTASVLGAEAGFSTGPFLVEAEYFRYKLDRRNSIAPNPHFKGYYVQGVWVLTGETRPYNPGEARFDAPKMNYNFNAEAGTWGAFELAARYSVVDLNYREGALGTTPVLGAVRGGEQKVSSVGVNWYLNPSMRMMLDFQHIDIDRLGATGLQTGQKYNALAARAQFNF